MSAKTEGQERSLFDLDETTWETFIHVISVVPAGHLFTVNSLRTALNEAGISNSQRGGLFARATRAGLMELAMHLGYELHEPSLGSSAHGAGVKVYRRLSGLDEFTRSAR